ncbi:hypothetical protein J2Z17_002457 [Rhizobium halophytocola]|uniref:Uncharacterized protein n=1 Tax=Rhizobium halophytocola TaxID=735519 RepID=A0ABS4DZD8_9HYPH|nr:hypothetical protein [Rhizobium halophytocola]
MTHILVLMRLSGGSAFPLMNLATGNQAGRTFRAL